MGETFESEHDDEFEDADEEQDTGGYVPPRRGRKRVDDVPDQAVENAADIPLLSHAGTSKSNTITYLKVTRLDGPRGVRGLKGKLAAESTYEDVARRYGNGTYKIEGCNQKHKVLAREEGLEIAIPGFDEDEGKQGSPQPVPGFNPSFTLHQMKMVTDMATEHGRSIKEQSAASADATRDMANQTMQMMTAFTTAQRESERSSYQAAAANQQQFFATLLATMQTAHAQQMEMLTAMNERSRQSEVDPMAMVQMFIDGLKTGGEMGGGDVEPWLAALKEGTGALGHLATLAKAGDGKATPQLPARPRALPSTTVERAPRAEPKRRKKRLPFQREEIRGIAQLRATLRKRGISFEDFLAQTSQYYQSAPDSELYEGDDGPVESEAHDAREQGTADSTET